MKNGVTVRHSTKGEGSYVLCRYTDGEHIDTLYFDEYDELGLVKAIAAWTKDKWNDEPTGKVNT